MDAYFRAALAVGLTALMEMANGGAFWPVAIPVWDDKAITPIASILTIRGPM